MFDVPSRDMQLYVICLLSQKGRPVRSIDVANWFGISRSTVSINLKELIAQGYVIKDSRGYLSLSEKGAQWTAPFRKKHDFYMKHLLHAGVDPERAELEACLAAQLISDRSFQLLEKAYHLYISDAEAEADPPEADTAQASQSQTEQAKAAQSHGTGSHLVVLAEEARQYILRNYSVKFSLDTIADALHVNKNYLSRVFKAVTGTTLLTFHNQVRCQRAQELLQDSTLSITQVSGLVGFYSSAHFSRIFQKITGLTPSAYRAQAGKT